MIHKFRIILIVLLGSLSFGIQAGGEAELIEQSLLSHSEIVDLKISAALAQNPSQEAVQQAILNLWKKTEHSKPILDLVNTLIRHYYKMGGDVRVVGGTENQGLNLYAFQLIKNDLPPKPMPAYVAPTTTVEIAGAFFEVPVNDADDDECCEDCCSDCKDSCSCDQGCSSWLTNVMKCLTCVGTQK